jgi:hypothetical protein
MCRLIKPILLSHDGISKYLQRVAPSTQPLQARRGDRRKKRSESSVYWQTLRSLPGGSAALATPLRSYRVTPRPDGTPPLPHPSSWLHKGHFSAASANTPTRPTWQFWASETLQKRLRNASVTLQKRSTSGLYILLGVFIHPGRFHGQRARCCGALVARVCECAWRRPCTTGRPLTPDS